MPQQINLCTPILLKPKRYFSAQTMAQALAVFVVVGGGLCGAWVWSLEQASDGLRQVIQTQGQEMDRLKAAMAANAASAAPLDPALQTQLQDMRGQVVAQEKVLKAMQQGRMVPGAAHSDRLILVSRSIPAQVWVTGVDADSSRLEVTGYTLEPSALNDWVGRLGASPLMQGLKLATVKVQNARLAKAVVDGAAVPAGREAWSFNLISAQPIAPVAPPANGRAP